MDHQTVSGYQPNPVSLNSSVEICDASSSRLGNESPKQTTDQVSTSTLRSWLLWWNTEDWWSSWIGLIFFGCVVAAVNGGIPTPTMLPWTHNPFLSLASVGNYGLIVLFFAMGGLLWLALASVGVKAWRYYPLGYLFVFTVALVSKIIASNVHLQKASLGASIWAILFGCCIRTLHDIFQPNKPLMPWLKVAQQTELYIAISLVLLCIDISVLRPLAPRALFVSWIDTPLLFMVVAMMGWRILHIDMQTAIILSGATFICGSSAAIALGASMGAPQKTDMPIAIISIFTIPSIIALPYIAQRFDFSPTVSGAWFGGCVDSTGGVIAAASIHGDKQAIDTSAVVKMMQNVLIGPISVLMAWAWSRYELRLAYKRDEELLRRHHEQDEQEGEQVAMDEISATVKTSHPSRTTARREKAHVLLWKRFPKFVIGFLLTAVLFNTVVSSDPEIRTNVNNYCFYVSEWFSTMSFVSIGLGLQLNEMRHNIRHLGKLCTLYVVAQLVDIVVTAVLAWVAFTHM